MPYRMSWYVQDIKAAIAEIVVCLELSNLQGVREGQFHDFPAFEISLVKLRVWLGGISREECVAEARSHHQTDTLWEMTRSADMIPMMVTKHHRLNIVDVEATFRQNIYDILLDPQPAHTLSDQVGQTRHEILPVRATTEVEEQFGP